MKKIKIYTKLLDIIILFMILMIFTFFAINEHKIDSVIVSVLIGMLTGIAILWIIKELSEY